MEAQQQQEYQYQYQTQIDTTTTPTASTFSYDPSSQVQTTYDHSAYYAAYQQHQPQQDYSSYYYPAPDYSSSYQIQTPQIDPSSIDPPGVPTQPDSQQTLLHNPQNYYYSPGVINPQVPPPQGYLPPGHSAYRGGGSHAGRSSRGAFGRHGRGRGGGRGKHTPGSSAAGAAASSVQGHATPGKPPPQMAWCELCRVDCNTLEILEQHKNGKKHKRNLKVHEELQNLSKQLTVQNPQMPTFQSKPENVPPKKPEGSEGNQLPSENVTTEPAPQGNKAESAPGKDMSDDAEPSSGALSSKALRKDNFVGRGGFKRKMRGGRGGKWMRAPDGSRRPVDLPKPKQVVPLICDLCNIKCESQVVFESHLAGKKHLSNVKRFQGHKETFGEGIQALYPTIPNLPSTSIIPQANQQGAGDAQALATMMLNQQGLQDPQAAQAALAQLLNQHGIHDAQTLLAQLIPYLVAQFQVPGSVPAPAVGFGMPTQISQLQGSQFLTGAENQNIVAENKIEQQNLTANAESQVSTGTNDKPGDGQSEQSKGVQPPENNNVGAEQNICVPAKEEATA